MLCSNWWNQYRFFISHWTSGPTQDCITNQGRKILWWILSSKGNLPLLVRPDSDLHLILFAFGIGFAWGSIFNLWHISLGWIPAILACIQANLSKFFFKNSISYTARSLSKFLPILIFGSARWDLPTLLPALLQVSLLVHLLVSGDQYLSPLDPCLALLYPSFEVIFSPSLRA